MRKQKKLIPRLYRISEEDDKLVKKRAKKYDSEAHYIRSIIRVDNLKNEKNTT